jgi:molecular chaperone GrpE
LSRDRPGDGDEEPDEAQGLEPKASGLDADPEHALVDALEPPQIEDAAEAFHQRARLAEDRLAEVLGAYRELRKENDAYRERVTKTIQRRFDHRHEGLLLKFIDILDNLDRALEAAQTSYAGEPLVEGLILVRTQLLGTLQDEGLERIPVLGLAFDPHLSEAVATEPVQDPDHHHVVVRESLRGYRIAGKIERASRVVIGEFAGAEAETPAAPVVPPPRAPRAVAPSAPRAAPREAEPTLEEIIARAEAQDPPADEPTLVPDAEALADAEPLWHDPAEDEK